MRQFLSCDWGTSSFRLRWVEAATLKILAEIKTDQGIASVFLLWQQLGEQDVNKRIRFYLDLVQEHILTIQKNQSVSLKGVPLVFSGMASSSIGLMNLSYGPIPFRTDGRDIPTAFVETDGKFDRPVILISGIRSEDDVMRGEETQLIGVMGGMEDSEGEKIFLFPGTHSKHIWVNDRQVKDFKTYMTGEYFDLLSRKSILSKSVEDNTGNANKVNWESFAQGVQQAVRSNLLHASFFVRTQELFGKLTQEENYDYLSGLLIGTELKELMGQDSAEIYLCCGSHLKLRYEAALATLGVEVTGVFSGQEIDEAVVRGQFVIYNQIKRA